MTNCYNKRAMRKKEKSFNLKNQVSAQENIFHKIMYGQTQEISNEEQRDQIISNKYQR